MSLPFVLPDWVPWWLPAVVLAPLILLVLAFVAMPFSVFGVKGRLEAIEARLDEIQGEIRSLALRLPEAGEPAYEPPPSAGRRAGAPFGRGGASRPPIPPAPREEDGFDIPRPLPRDDRAAAQGDPRTARIAPRREGPRIVRERSEPRLDWSRDHGAPSDDRYATPEDRYPPPPDRYAAQERPASPDDRYAGPGDRGRGQGERFGRPGDRAANPSDRFPPPERRPWRDEADEAG